ncbi:YafY family transcriptional regulator, partial [Listeria monocytogenes]|nr:YafY family transcriptional regulator [Listeria monocytogenes]
MSVFYHLFIKGVNQVSTTRLFGLIYHLLNHEKATTSELAKQ